MSFITVFSQMLIFFALIMTGAVCRRKGIVNAESSHSISRLIVNVFNPAIIFSSVLGNSSEGQGGYIGLISVIAVTMFASFIIMSMILSHLFTKDKNQIKIYKLMTVYSNVGFMGIPLVDALFGNSAVIYVAIFILVYNILIYTHGVFVLQNGSEGGFSLAGLKEILNMGTFACCMTLIVFAFKIPVNPVIRTGVSYLGNVATPMSMMTIGFMLGAVNLVSVFTEWKLYIFSFIKLIIIPIVGILILRQFSLPDEVMGISAIMLGMPIGNLPVMLAEQYGINSESCARGIIITTLLSVVTVPLIMGLI